MMVDRSEAPLPQKFPACEHRRYWGLNRRCEKCQVRPAAPETPASGPFVRGEGWCLTHNIALSGCPLCAAEPKRWRPAKADSEGITLGFAQPDDGFKLAVSKMRERVIGADRASDVSGMSVDLIKSMIDVIALASCGRVCTCKMCEASRAAFARAVLAPNTGVN